MGFWVFMFFMILIIPLSMITMGRKYKIPKNINKYYGYRTNMSMKNQDTWIFSQELFKKVSFKIGSFILLPSIIPMLAVVGRNDDNVGKIGLIISFLQVFCLILVIVFVEKGLRENFDEKGNRI